LVAGCVAIVKLDPASEEGDPERGCRSPATCLVADLMISSNSPVMASLSCYRTRRSCTVSEEAVAIAEQVAAADETSVTNKATWEAVANELASVDA
jgi:hypothetical protein